MPVAKHRRGRQKAGRSAARRAITRRRMHFETLEDRTLLSFVVSQDPPDGTGGEIAGLAPEGISFVDVNFSEAMDTTSFSPLQDVTSFTGPGGLDLLTAITGFSWIDDDTLRINFVPLTQQGPYEMHIGPQILTALDGSPMNQDSDGTAGEAAEDQYVVNFAVGPVNFPGMDFGDSGGFVPPDTHAAAGPGHVVEVVNSTVAFYNKQTGTELFQQSLFDFFAPVSPAFDPFDPKVTYDELSGRFVVIALDVDFFATTSHLLVAVSDDSNPNGSWEMHRLNVEDVSNPEVGIFEDRWGDYPGLGWDADAIYVTLNMFGFNTFGYYHTSIVTIDKDTVLDNDSDTVTFYDYDVNSDHFTLQPAIMHGAESGDSMYFVSESGLANGDTMRILEITGRKMSFAPQIDIHDVEVDFYGFPPSAAQPGGVFEVNDTRILNAEWRNDRLVATHTIAGDFGDATVRWYEFNTNNSVSLTQQGEIDPGPGIHTYFPSIAIAPNGDLGMTFMQSSSSEFISMYVTMQFASDPAGTMRDPLLVKAGEDTYTDFTGSPFRGGDYSSVNIDPVNGSFWGANEYATSASSENWGTWITNFSRETFVTPADGLTMMTVTPALAGELNTFTVTGATPGEVIAFAWSLQPGTTPVPGLPGVSVDLANAKKVGLALADADGNASITVPIPEAAADVTVWFQAVSLTSGEVSNRVRSTFEEVPPITIDGDFSDWTSVPSFSDPAGDPHDTEHTGEFDTPDLVDHPDVDLLEYKVTHDDENLYFYFRSAGEIGATQVEGPGQEAGRYYVIVTIDVDQDNNTGYGLHEGGYYPTTDGYDMNGEIEFYNGEFNTGHYINHGAQNDAELDQAFLDQSSGQFVEGTDGPYDPGFVDVAPGSYDYYTQWVYHQNDTITFVEDKGPVVLGIIHGALSPDGHELEMVVPFRGFLVDENGDPIIGVGSTLDLSFSLEASGELAPGGEWASDTGDPINGYFVSP